MDNKGYISDASSYASFKSVCQSVSWTKEETTQTESQPLIVNSWKIETHRQKNPSNPKPMDKDMFLIQTHSVGFNQSSQTLFRDLYSRNRNELVEIISSWRVLRLLLPSFLYFILYIMDQILDVLICIQFFQQENYFLFGFSLVFLIVPSFLVSIYAYEQ